MNVEELLRDHGDHWQTPDVNGPDLDAAIGRSVRRNRIARLAVAAVAVLAVGSTALAVLPGRADIPAIPAPAVTPTLGATAVPRVIAVPDKATDAALAAVAKALEGDFIRVPSHGELKPTIAMVVGSTVSAASAAGVLAQPRSGDSARPVWVLQMESRFGCGPCTTPEDRGTIRPVLRALVTQDDLEVIATGTFTARTDLGALGTPTALDLTRDPGWYVLRDSVRRELATIDKARLDSDRAVQTTLWRVQKRLQGQAPEPLSFRDVWLVRLKGAFTCSTCTQLNGSITGPVLVLVIDAVNGDLIESLIADQSFEEGPLAGQRSMYFAPSSVR